MMGVHESVEPSLPDEIHPGRGNPRSLLVGHREFAVGACAGTIGPAESRGHHLYFGPVRRDLEESSRVFVVRPMPFNIVEISLRVGLKAGSIFVDVLPDAAPVIEALVEICLPTPVEIVQAGDLVPAEHVDPVIDNLEPQRLEQAGRIASPCHFLEFLVDSGHAPHIAINRADRDIPVGEEVMPPESEQYLIRVVEGWSDGIENIRAFLLSNCSRGYKGIGVSGWPSSSGTRESLGRADLPRGR